MIATLPSFRLEAEPTIARAWPLALGLALALTVSLGGSLLTQSGVSLSEEAAEAPSTSCVGCHTAEAPDGASPGGPSGALMQRQAACRR